MTLLWLGLIGFVIVAVGMPLIEQFASGKRDNHLLRHIFEGLFVYLVEVLVFSGITAVGGYVVFGVAGAVTFGLVGLTTGLIVVSFLGAIHELNIVALR